MDAFLVVHSLEALADDMLGQAKLYIMGDMAGAFLSVPVALGSQEKLAMMTLFGLYAYTRMPFGAKNSGNVYAWLMHEVTGELMRCRELLAFFDDILIPMRSMREGLLQFAKFLQAIEDANLHLKPEKMCLFKTEAEWLGHRENPMALCPSMKLTAKVREWPVLDSKEQLRAFTGLCSYYQSFVPNFAKMAARQARSAVYTGRGAAGSI